VDAIVLDLSMPHMNGIEVLENLMAISHNCGVPVLVATAMSDPAVLAQAREAGAAEILHKPFLPSALVQAVHRCLSTTG
jgi:CheY-like chemotaxis protein